MDGLRKPLTDRTAALSGQPEITCVHQNSNQQARTERDTHGLIGMLANDCVGPFAAVLAVAMVSSCQCSQVVFIRSNAVFRRERASLTFSLTSPAVTLRVFRIAGERFQVRHHAFSREAAMCMFDVLEVSFHFEFLSLLTFGFALKQFVRSATGRMP
jgi:hypothetical protein